MTKVEEIPVASSAAPPLVRWGAIFAGAVVSLAFLLLATALWLALAYSSHMATYRDHLDWWIGGSAIGALLLAGLLSGGFSGTRGAGAGLASGVTTWSLVTLGAAAVGIPATLSAGNVHRVVISQQVYLVTTLTWWSVFWSMLIGLGAAGLGGLIGGALPRRRRISTETAVITEWVRGRLADPDMDLRRPSETEAKADREDEPTAETTRRRPSRV
jgi:hypothetical protein